MIDEKIIEGLREYIKDCYIPPTDDISTSTSSSRVLCMMECEIGYFEVDGLYDVDEDASFRDISDESSEYIKKHRKPGGFDRLPFVNFA